MRSLETLKKKASRKANVLGHRLTWGLAYGNATSNVFGQRGTCRLCGCDVRLNTDETCGPTLRGEAIVKGCLR